MKLVWFRGMFAVSWLTVHLELSQCRRIEQAGQHVKTGSFPDGPHRPGPAIMRGRHGIGIIDVFHTEAPCASRFVPSSL